MQTLTTLILIAALVACEPDGDWDSWNESEQTKDDAPPSGSFDNTDDPATGPTHEPGECSSGTWWRGDDDDGSTRMKPGGDCNDCHRREREGPIYAVAGTVYTHYDEPDDCNGSEDVTVVIEGAQGGRVTLTTNSAGNFYAKDSELRGLTWPLTVATAVGGDENWMNSPVDEGSCNDCHTQDGDQGAPGRVVVP